MTAPNYRLGRDPRLAAAALGWQDLLRGGGTTGAGDLASFQPMAGRSLTAGTWYFVALVSAASSLDVTLRLQSLTGGATVPTVTMYKTLFDGVTEKLDSTGASTAVTFGALTAGGTMKTTSLTGLNGEQVVIVKVVVPAGETAVYDVAEYTAR